MGDLQNPGMATVSISPQRSTEGAYPYEMMDYADITYFLKVHMTRNFLLAYSKELSK